MVRTLENFPPGPLDYYRKKASFDWKKMKIFIDTEEMVKFEDELHEMLRTHPEFQELPSSARTIDEERRISVRQFLALKKNNLATINACVENVKRPAILQRVMLQYNTVTFGRQSLSSDLFEGILLMQGTKEHAKFLEKSQDGEFCSCFAMTEIGHGSNTQALRTTATYDKETEEFVLHTPDFEAAKCWAGGLGQTASFAVVYAQLYINGICYGIHIFVVPIRNPDTLLPYPGVILGDMGEKIGLNGLDNGFLIFDHYRIPRQNLLNKTSVVTPQGEYVTSLKERKRRHGAAIGALSFGRVHITGASENYGTKALTIAIRYAAVRKQFGHGDGDSEIPILEYQSHQYRLLPYLAAAYVVRSFSLYLFETIYQSTLDSIFNTSFEGFPDLVNELHFISAASKPVSSWLFRDAIQECREACGGHGYLKVAGIGRIRDENDPNCTYEGENHVLIQQTTNWLIRLEVGQNISTPMKSADFLSNIDQILELKFSAGNLDEVICPKTIIEAYQWLVCYLLKRTKEKFQAQIREHGDQFLAKNNTQVYYAKNLGIAFIQHFFLQKFLEVIQAASDTNIRRVLSRLFSLFGLWSLEKFLATLYEGGYAQGPQASHLIHEAVLKLCHDLKDDAVSLIDAIAPPDFLLDSVLGASDGQVYKRLQSAIFRNPYAMSRPTWWKDIVDWKSNIKNKL